MSDRQGADHFAVNVKGNPDADDVFFPVFEETARDQVMPRMVPHRKLMGRERSHPPDLYAVEECLVGIGDPAEDESHAFPFDIFLEYDFFPQPARALDCFKALQSDTLKFSVQN